MRWDTEPRARTGRVKAGGAQGEVHGEVDDEREVARERIGRASPEGRPAHPEWGVTAIGLAIVAVVVLVCAVAVGAGIVFGPIAGFLVLMLGLGVAVVGNPEIWAAGSRAAERHEIANDGHHHRE